MLDPEFLEKLPDEPLAGIKAIAEMGEDLYLNKSAEEKFLNYDSFIEALGLFQAFAEAHNLKFEYPNLTTDKHRDIDSIYQFFAGRRNKAEQELSVLLLESAKEKLSVRFKNVFYYEFTEGDLTKIQELLNEIRKLTQETKEIDENQRSRILKRI